MWTKFYKLINKIILNKFLNGVREIKLKYYIKWNK